MTTEEAHLYQRLAAFVVYAGATLRAAWKSHDPAELADAHAILPEYAHPYPLEVRLVRENFVDEDLAGEIHEYKTWRYHDEHVQVARQAQLNRALKRMGESRYNHNQLIRPLPRRPL